MDPTFDAERYIQAIRMLMYDTSKICVMRGMEEAKEVIAMITQGKARQEVGNKLEVVPPLLTPCDKHPPTHTHSKVASSMMSHMCIHH